MPSLAARKHAATSRRAGLQAPTFRRLLCCGALLVAACPSPHDDAGAKDAFTGSYLYVGEPMPKPMLPTGSLLHMGASVTPKHQFTVGAAAQQLTLQAIESRVTAQVQLLQLPAKTVVSGTWDSVVHTRSIGLPTDLDFTFTPAAPLQQGGEYLFVTTPGNGLSVAPKRRTRVQFHVGYLQRVVQIELPPATKPGALPPPVSYIGLVFSEPIDHKLVASKIKVYDAQGSAITTSDYPVKPQNYNYAVVSVSPALPPDKQLTVAVSVDVGNTAADKLDGKYTGKAGSGPLRVTRVPKDLPGGRWVPDAAP